MKKLLSIALCTAVASAFAAGEPPTAELGTIGVTAITTPLSNAIVAVSYDDLAGGSGMVYSNLVKTTNLTVGDKLVQFSYDGSDKGKYTSWVLAEGGSGDSKYKYWKEQTEFYKDDSGNDSQLISPTPDTVRGAVGTGIWLVRQNPIDVNGSTNSFYIYGKPVDSQVSTPVAGKWTLLGNPKQTDAKPTISGMADGDMIQSPTVRGMLNVYKYNGTSKMWVYWNESNEPAETDAPKSPAGLGFWYVSTAEGSIEVKW